MILWPLPDQRHLYMLVAGVVIGVLLGPAVLDRFAPHLYDPMFVGSGDTTERDEAEQALYNFLNDEDVRLDRIEQIMAQYELVGDEDDSITIARDEQIANLTNAFADEQDSLKDALLEAVGVVEDRKRVHRDKLSGMATAMLLLVVLLFAAESIISPQRDELEKGQAKLPPALSRLVTVRYGLMAGWLMLMLAQPAWLRGIDPVFGGLLLIVVLAAGLVPLGKKAT